MTFVIRDAEERSQLILLGVVCDSVCADFGPLPVINDDRIAPNGGFPVSFGVRHTTTERPAFHAGSVSIHQDIDRDTTRRGTGRIEVLPFDMGP